MNIKASLLIHSHPDIVETLSAIEAYEKADEEDAILHEKLLRQIEENASDRAKTYRKPRHQ